MTDRAPGPAAPRADEQGMQYAHALESLLELGCEMGTSLDLFQTGEQLLLNLMGQFGTARSALWLLDEDPQRPPVLVHCHGFSRPALEAAHEDCHRALRKRFANSHSPAMTASLLASTSAAEARALRQAAIEVLGPLHGRGELVGWLALGSRMTGEPWTEREMRVLQAALGLVGMALQNMRLYHRVLEANRQLRETNEHLEATARLKSQFLSNVNHELRTPLTVVLATLDCVLDSQPPAEIATPMLASAHERALDLKALLEKLLTFSDSVEGRLEARLETVDLASRLDDLHAARRPGVVASLHPFHYARDAELPAVSADPVHVHLILNELIDNALKFTRPGTPIHLRACAGVGAGGHRVEIAVTDEGDGVPLERMGTLFTAFEQLDGSATRVVGGMGMGLALARRLAEGMSGELRAHSEAGQGCTFTLSLPAV